MSFILWDSIAAGGLFLGMLLCFEVGRRIGIARRARDSDGVSDGSGPVEAAVFGLLGLLLAFTFSGAASRFEDRRHLIAAEANAIGTAFLRVDLLPSEAQPEMRQLFRRYLETRVAAYRRTADETAMQASLSEAATLQRELWSKAASASRQEGAPAAAAMLLLPALNEMIDTTTTRAVATQNHPPRIIFLLLAGLSLIASLLVGYVMCRTRVRNWFYMLTIATTLSFTLYVVLDLEYPRLGLIRIDAADQTLIDLRALMR